jgi:hypothetical protein
MKADGGPAQPSAPNGRDRFLRVQCSTCKQSANIDLELVTRRPGTPAVPSRRAASAPPMIFINAERI